MDTVAEDTSLASPAVARPADGTGSFLGVLLCFALSGFAALLYQTAWLRQFSIAFGSSELAVATVLAAYMGGLALGATLAGKFVGRLRRPVLVYGLLELGIAAGALLVPTGLRLARDLQSELIGQQPELVASGGWEQPLFYAIAAFAVILVPTTFMGATLPLLTGHAVQRKSQIGTRVGLLYAINTAGAACGTLVAAFLLLPQIGLGATVQVGVGVNALVFVLAAWISRGSANRSAPVQDDACEAHASNQRSSWILPLIAISGLTSFTYEVLWTRLFSQLLGGSVYAFATMLATFLVGITLGSAIAASLARSRKGSLWGFVVAQLGIAIFSALLWNQLDGLPARFAALEGDAGRSVFNAALLAASVLLPSTLFIGATFPFALRLLAVDVAHAGPASARVYSWNTVGAIAGALLSGFFLIPSLGFALVAQIMVGVNLLLMSMSAWLLGLSRNWSLPITALAILLATQFSPQTPETLLRNSYLGPAAGGEILHFAVGRSATVLAVEEKGHLGIRSNGLPEAGVAPKGAIPFGLLTPQYLALLPVIARPSAKTMMVIGFGGGVTIESIPPSIAELDVIELEPEILNANEAFANRRRINPLDDPRLTVTFSDARGALALTDESWDIIVSQPSHPWTAGASHLYTREFLEVAKQHLNGDGVFVQWMSAGFLDEELFASLGATLLDSFDHVRLYRPNGTMLIFLASDGDLDVERKVAESGAPMASAREWWSQVGFTGVNDLLAFLALEQDGLAELCTGAPVCTDDANLLAMRARPAKSNFASEGLAQLLFPFDPLLDSTSSLRQALVSEIDTTYLVRRLAFSNLLPRAAQLLKLLPADSAEKGRVQGTLEASLIGAQWATGNRNFQTAFQIDPKNQAGRFLLLRDDLPRIAAGLAGSEEKQSLAQELAGAPLLVYSGWKALAKRQWNEVRALEPGLANVPPSAPWFMHATRLRAAWRLHWEQAPDRAQLALDAIVLIDRALVYEPNPFLIAQRAHAALAADLPLHFAESMGQLSEFVGPRRAALPPGAAEGLRNELATLASDLEELRADARVPPRTFERITERVHSALAGKTPVTSEH
ncbi:MAG: spermidine synthase [Candidatus Paceibacteria bacterium]|jgi:spermidine synthase